MKVKDFITLGKGHRYWDLYTSNSHLVSEAGVGKIIKGVNTTIDVQPGETKRQAAKFGNHVDSNGRPPELNTTAKKNSNANTAFNLGLAEATVLDAPTPSVYQISDKHQVPVRQILSQLKKGIQVEYEHTSDPATAIEIALDHLNEFPDYYDRLEKIERNSDD